MTNKATQATKTINEQLAARLRDTRATVAAWKINAAILKPVVKALALMDIEAEMTNSTMLYARSTGDQKALDAIVATLARCGFSTDSECKITEWTSVTFRHPGTTVQVYLSFSPTVCKRIQVGTETITRPVYRTVCEGFDESANVETTIDASAI